MRSEEFISVISGMSQDDDQFEEMKKGLPLGLDSVDSIVRAQKLDKPFTLRNTCVTGIGRTRFISRFLITVSCLYEKTEACFFIVSPKTEYGELLRLKSMDATVPFIREKGDVQLAVEAVKGILTCS